MEKRSQASIHYNNTQNRLVVFYSQGMDKRRFLYALLVEKVAFYRYSFGCLLEALSHAFLVRVVAENSTTFLENYERLSTLNWL